MINEAVAALNITRIIIAHRPQTIAIADRIRLEHGKFVDVGHQHNVERGPHIIQA